MNKNIKFSGLTSKEVLELTKKGLVNTQVESYSPSNLKIFFNNIFTIINVALFPLLIALLLLGVTREVFSFSAFLVLNTIINTIEEIRVKKRLEELKTHFQINATVIRNEVEQVIKAEDIVGGDLIIGREGDSILTDGEVLKSSYIQIDESALTGESNYIDKKVGDEVFSGSYVVTGEVYYKATKVGKNNFLNELGSRSLKYGEKKSRLESFSQKLILLFTALGIGAGVIHYFVLNNIGSIELKTVLLSVTTIISVAIPQAILVIMVLTYVISVAKLGKLGILVQKKGSIDDLSGIDTICLDKTGTITTNEMKVEDILLESIDKKDLELIFSRVKGKLYGVNRTMETLMDYFNVEGVLDSFDESSFDQIPFTSKNKFSAFQIKGKTLVLGIQSKLIPFIEDSKHNLINEKIKTIQDNNQRLILGVILDGEFINDIKNDVEIKKSSSFFVVGIAEDLNPGIEDILNDLKSQGIEVKVISGDSEIYVTSIAKSVNLIDKNGSSVDLSVVKEKDLEFYKNIVINNSVFARCTPQDKEGLISALQSFGKKVAMIGDGVNDVLGIKKSDVGISMESGAKVTREVADIVLLKNDYTKIPTIFFEGNNIIFNLKYSTKVFFARTLMIIILGLFFTFIGQPVPLLPTSALIFTFVGSSAVGYLLTFTRSKVLNQTSEIGNVLRVSTPYGIWMGLSTLFLWFLLKDTSITFEEMNTALTIGLSGILMGYTIYLLFVGGKIPKNWGLIIGGFIFGMVASILQTVAPLTQISGLFEQLIFVVTLIVASFVLYIAFNEISKYSSEVNFIKYLLPIVIFPVAFFFPVRDYFAVIPLPIQYFPYVFIAIIVNLIGVFVLANRFGDK